MFLGKSQPNYFGSLKLSKQLEHKPTLGKEKTFSAPQLKHGVFLPIAYGCQLNLLMIFGYNQSSL